MKVLFLEAARQEHNDAVDYLELESKGLDFGLKRK